MKLSFFAKFVGLVVLGLVVVFIIDPLDKTTISTPFLLGIVLMALSLRQSVELVVATSVLYVLLTAFALQVAREYFDSYVHVIPHPYFWMFQRMGLFLLLCTLSIYLARYRTESQRLLKHVQDILAKLPAPVVISDAAGYVVYTNEALNDSFQQKTADLVGKRYVDFFMTDIQEGKAMRYYIELFGGEANKVHDLQITPFHGEKSTTARLTCLGSGSDRVMITVLSGDLNLTAK
jgi:PAS domain-containing protein